MKKCRVAKHLKNRKILKSSCFLKFYTIIDDEKW